MVKIKFETGQTVNFDGNPTEADIEEVAKSLKPVSQPAPVEPKKSFLASTAPSFKATETTTGTPGKDIATNLAKTVANIPSSARNLARNTIAPVNPLDTNSPLNIGSNIVKSAQTASSIVKDRGILGGIKDLAGGIADVAKKGVNMYKGVGQNIYNKLEGDVAQTGSVTKGLQKSALDTGVNVAKVGIEDPLLIPSLIYAPGKVGTASAVERDAISAISKTATKPIKTAVVKTFEPSVKKLESRIVENFEKGVKPLINAKTTPTRAVKYKSDIVDAVKTINQNKANLSFADDVGDVITGQSPKTLQQLSESLEQTKKKVFQEYDALAKQAGGKGLEIDTTPIANELDGIITNEALQISNPSAVQYAQELKDRLNYRKISAQTAQDVVQNYNKSLEAFYRNPTYDTATKAGIDAFMVEKLRGSLDEGITSLTGESYQALKNKYGSLKAVEKDVVKAALRDARKNNKGFFDVTDIFSGGDIVSGLLTLNPAQIAKGAGARGIKEYYKYLNSPNRAIKNLFNSVDKLEGKTNIPKSTPIPNKQGGFIRIPGVKATNIHPDDAKVMKSFIDNVRVGADFSEAKFSQIEKLAERFNISMDKGLTGVAKELENILNGNKKVKGTLLPGSLPKRK